MQPHKRKLKVPMSVRIAVTAAAVIAAGWLGWQAYARQRLGSFQMTEIAPGQVNLVAVRPEAGWRIIVSNSMAQLAEVTGGMEHEVNDDEAQNGKRLPMREFIASMRGDGESLGYLAEKLADITDESIPENAPRWSVADIEKAIGGDAQLQKELEADLQCRLDGRPMDAVSISSLINGIIIEVPVTATIRIKGQLQEVKGIVRSPYKADLAEAVSRTISTKFNPKPEYVAGVYVEEGLKVLNGERKKEDVRLALKSRYSPGRIKSLIEKPQNLLDNSTILITDSHLDGATVDEYQAGRKMYADITLNVNDEGRMRLWKYSHEHPGFQLLLVVDGLAYAAPRISNELAERYIQITRMTEPDMAKEAVTRIQEVVKERK